MSKTTHNGHEKETPYSDYYDVVSTTVRVSLCSLDTPDLSALHVFAQPSVTFHSSSSVVGYVYNVKGFLLVLIQECTMDCL